MRVALLAQAFDAGAELAAFTRTRDDEGALASFVGYCRGRRDDEAVSALELTHYPGFSDEAVMRIGERCAARHAITAGLILHRVGVVLPGEAIVLVAALSRHRTDALAAVEEMIDTLKTDAPLWKREVTDAGMRWIEPTGLDHRRRAHYEEGSSRS